MLTALAIAATAAALYAWMVHGDRCRAKAVRAQWIQNIGR